MVVIIIIIINFINSSSSIITDIRIAIMGIFIVGITLEFEPSNQSFVSSFITFILIILIKQYQAHTLL